MYSKTESQMLIRKDHGDIALQKQITINLLILVLRYSQNSSCDFLSSATRFLKYRKFSKIPKVSRSNHYI